MDDAVTITTTSNLSVTHRAGALDINFPLVDLGGLLSFDLDGTVYSADSVMNLTYEDGHLLNDTDWEVIQDYALPTGLNGVIAGKTIPYHNLPMFPLLLSLTNDAGFSTASLSSAQTSTIS